MWTTSALKELLLIWAIIEKNDHYPLFRWLSINIEKRIKCVHISTYM